MYRFLVNNESHGIFYAYAYDEMDRFKMFVPEEKEIQLNEATEKEKPFNPVF